MPQIWPINWIGLFAFFIAAFIVFLSAVYFVYIVKHRNSKQSDLQVKTITWEW